MTRTELHSVDSICNSWWFVKMSIVSFCWLPFHMVWHNLLSRSCSWTRYICSLRSCQNHRLVTASRSIRVAITMMLPVIPYWTGPVFWTRERRRSRYMRTIHVRLTLKCKWSMKAFNVTKPTKLPPKSSWVLFKTFFCNCTFRECGLL
jgi:hypothetical protein